MLCFQTGSITVLRTCACLLAGFMALGAAGSALAAKTDVVTLKNGDRITGEVKRLDRGRLRYSTDDMGTIYIEWDKIAKVVSKEFHRLQLGDGTVLYGTLSDAGGDGMLAVEGDRGTEAVPLVSYVSITPVEQGWTERIDLTLGAGYGYTKASDVTTFNAYADSEFQGERIAIDTRFRSDYTNDGEEGTSRNKLTSEYRRLTGNRNYRFILGVGDQNDELDLDLRLGLGAGLGRYFVQNNRRRFLAAGGLGVTYSENGDDTTDTDLEGILTAQYDDFLYDTPKLDLTMRLGLFPNITDAGRVRGSYDVTLRKEFVEDFFLDFSLNGTYDTDPASDDASKTDYAATTGLSYDF